MADMRKAFLADIIENIDDDTPRLVFADWLEDHGDEARAEFIRLQCRLAAEQVGWVRPWRSWDRNDSLTPRELELIAEHGDEWKKEAPKWATTRFAYYRGFVSRVSTNATQWLRGAARLYRFVPVEGLQCGAGNDMQLEALSALPEWKYVRVLNFGTHELIKNAVAPFFASADLRRLVTLAYTYHGTGVEAVEPLLASDRLSHLRCLILGGRTLGVEGAALLASSDLLCGLRSLGIYGTASDLPGITHLMWSPGVGGLEELTLWSSEPGAQMAVIAVSPYLSNLRQLTLGHGTIGDEAVLALATSPYLTKLTDLSLYFGTEPPAMREIICESEALLHLRRLRLDLDGECRPVLARLAERRRERGIE
jgi:uncharacterized protein (TIGR02996 family)